MHNGSVPTLEAVVDLYDRGGVVHRPGRSPEVVALNLREQQKFDLVAFLRTLTSTDAPVAVPVLPR
jgi:cytochrome c peroxidase